MTEIYIPTFEYLNTYEGYPVLRCPNGTVYELCYLGPACGIDRISTVEYDKSEGRIMITYKRGNFHCDSYTTIPEFLLLYLYSPPILFL